MFSSLRRSALAVTLTAFVLCPSVFGERVTLPEHTVSVMSPEGQHRLESCKDRHTFYKLAIHFDTQVGHSHCGPASACVVLNAMHVKAPVTVTHAPFHLFEQDNFFSEAVNKILPASKVQTQGCTVEELANMIGCWGVHSKAYHASASSVDEFRKLASSACNQGHSCVIVNFHREELGQKEGGHFSPLAAYHPETDSFLVMDVARFRYPPFWVTTKDLFTSMNTPDSVSKKSRGFIVVSPEGGHHSDKPESPAH